MVTTELRAWAENIYIVERPDVRDMGIMFATRITIVKLADGSLRLDSPVPVRLRCYNASPNWGPFVISLRRPPPRTSGGWPAGTRSSPRRSYGYLPL
jgi:hypothetical protein